MATFGPGSVVVGITNVGNLRCCCGCSVCGSTPTSGPDWTASVTGYTDRFSTMFTAAQQAFFNLTTTTPYHNNINGSSYVLTPPGIGSLRSHNSINAAYDVIIPSGGSHADDSVIGAFWDEVNTTYGTCSIGSYSTNRSNYTVSASANENLIINVFCPGGNGYDLDVNSVGVAISFSVNLALFASGFTYSKATYVAYRAFTYIRVPYSTIACPVGLTLDLNSNLVYTTGGQSGVQIFNSFPLECSFFSNQTNYDLPFTGSLSLVS